MASVLGEVLEWAADLEYWEQAALLKVLAGKQLAEGDYQELLTYLLEDASLTDSIGQRAELHFPQKSAEEGRRPIRLVAVSDLQNINALVEKQTLKFSPNLTAVYGRNGSGKSGYARVLGCAGFTRGDRNVLPDVTRADCDSLVLSAVIEVADGTSTRKINYRVGIPCPDLCSVYVFDSTSVRVHLSGSNTFSFSPAGLIYLTELAHATDEVRGRLGKMIDERRQVVDFLPRFLGESSVTEWIKSLGPGSSLEELDRITALSDADADRMAQLEREIAALKSKGVAQEIATLDQQIGDMEDLSRQMESSCTELQGSVVSDVQKAVDLCGQLDREASSLGVDAFGAEGFRCIGSSAWQAFVEAAKKLAEAEQEEGQRYPAEDGRCLLCHQPLSEEARRLILSLWRFVEGEVKSRHEAAKQELEKKAQRLRALDVAYFDPTSTCRRTLSKLDGGMEQQVVAFMSAAQTRRNELAELAEGHGAQATLSSGLPTSVCQDMGSLIEKLRESRSELAAMKVDERVRVLEQELLSLQHRKVLGQNLAEIRAYILRQRWAKQAEGIGGSTRHITKKYKDLFEQLVTDRYLELFTALLQDLQRPLKVRVKTTGRKGEICKQIVLESVSPSSAPDQATPDKVLSEGEKRAVALADFLTEVSLDETSSAIVLDDPVTSLDLEWRDTISRILAKEAKQRQVVVFTHDLPFLYYLKRDAEAGQIELATHWVRRGELDDKPGYVFLNNCPALEKEYKSTARARDFYKLAKDAAPAEQERLLRDGFGALRSTYEAFIVFDLFGGVVSRFEERINFLQLRTLAWDGAITGQIVAKCEHLSRFIEAHLHTDTFVQKPSCTDLLKEIDDFEALKKRHKELARLASQPRSDS